MNMKTYIRTNPSLQQCNKEEKTQNYIDKKERKNKKKTSSWSCFVERIWGGAITES